jgi:outer membrane protein assembly factor BamA
MYSLILCFFSFLPQPTDTIPSAPASHDRIITINRILIIGNKLTRNSIISRELSLKVGDTISTRRIDQVLLLDKNKIYNLRLFNTVVIRWIDLGTNEADILIDVSERWYTFPVPIFDLSDRNFNEWVQTYNADFRRVNYGLRLYQYNFRGRNETVRLTAQFGFVKRFELSYRIPYIDRQQKHGLTFDLDYVAPKNAVYATENHQFSFLESETVLRRTRGAGITYTFRKSFYQSHSFTASYRSSTIADTISQLNENYYGNGETSQRYGTLQYVFNSDHRDVIAYPLKGYQITALVERLGLLPGDNVSLWNLSASYAYHKPVGNKNYFSNFTSLYRSFPENQPYSQFFGLGYKKQFVRGYEIYVIEGPFYVLNKTTFKRRIFSRTWEFDRVPLEQFRYFPISIYAKIYADAGYAQNYPIYAERAINTRLSDRWLGGLGGGLDVVTFYDFVMRFEYTFTLEKTSGFFFHVKKEF